MKKISVIISSKNRSAYLKQALEKLPVASFLKYNVELILVDNSSIDDSFDIMTNYSNTAPFSVKCIRQETKGLGSSYGRNLGISLAQGEILVFTDDDCYLQEDYFEQLYTHFELDRFQFCGGRILLWDETDAMESVNYNNHFQLFPAKSFIPAGDIQGANMVVHRSVFEKIGGFNIYMGAGTDMRCEDIELMGRASVNGFTGAFVPELVVYHHHRRKIGTSVYQLRKNNDIGRGAYYASLCDQGFVNAWKHGIEMSMELTSKYGENPYDCIVNELEGALIYFKKKQAGIF